MRYAFDERAFAALLSELTEEHSAEVIGALVGIEPATVRHYAAGRFAPHAPYPSMTLLLAVCNLAVIPPGAFFTVKYR